MKSRFRPEQLISLIMICAGGLQCYAQTSVPSPQPTPPPSESQEIDSQYVVTYTPKRPLALATEEEYRRLKVASGRGGLQVHARRGYVAKPQ
ncbi:MAG TPA: hypothetical protein VGJ66_15570 [Pyrinomonadaceae bacterium]